MATKNALGKRIRLAIENVQRGELEEGLLHTSIAVDITASREAKLRRSTGKIFKEFLKKNAIILYGVGFGITCRSLSMPYKHPDVPATPNAAAKDGLVTTNADVVHILYHACRCSMAHSGELPANITLNSIGTVGPERHDQPLQLSSQLIYALLITAVASPVNRDETFDVPNRDFVVTFSAFHSTFRWRVGTLWGKREFLEKVIKEARARLDAHK